MTMHSRGRGAGDLARAIRRFDQWRRSSPRGRFPHDLWTLAAETASRHGVDATEPVDFRKGIDGLAVICRKQLEQDPMTGYAFGFRNRKGAAVKILAYDGQGFWLCQKRLSQGRFEHWPSGGSASRLLQSHQLQVLLAGGNADAAPGGPQWRPLKVAG